MVESHSFFDFKLNEQWFDLGELIVADPGQNLVRKDLSRLNLDKGV